MKQIKSWNLVFGAGAIALMGVAGCADRNKDGVPESGATTTEIDKSVQGAGNKMAGAAENVAEAGGNVADAAANQVAAAPGAVAGAFNTGGVKTAIMNNAAMAGANINVTTKNKNVMLNGTVKSATQKNMAGNIAKKQATGYTVMNNLKVSK